MDIHLGQPSLKNETVQDLGHIGVIIIRGLHSWDWDHEEDRI